MMDVAFVVVLACLSSVAAENSSLRLVNVLYRHGDRSPIDVFPTDRNPASSWPQGMGWLTTLGMQQQHGLGAWLRQRYAVDTKFMSTDYKRTEILVVSSDEDRALMSAYSNLAGLYPPSAGQVWNKNISWQPIPVHTRPKIEDNVLNLGEPCPRYQQLKLDTLKTHGITEEEKRNKPFYEFVGKMSGWSHENISTIWRIADTVFCERSHNMTLNSWVNTTVYAKLRELEALQFTLLYNSTEKSRLTGGPLLKEIIENMKLKIANETADPTKMFMYSGHDTTVAALLTAMGVYNKMSPPYTATVITELHEAPAGKFFVKVFYRNTTGLATNDTLRQLIIPGCVKADCPFETFVESRKNEIPGDWLAECGLPSPGSSTTSLTTSWIVAIVLGGLLLIVLLIVGACFVRSRKKRSSETFLYGKFDVET